MSFSSEKKEIIEMVATIVALIKKEFPDEAATIISNVLKIGINID